jgi:hypothetical protein
MVVHHLRARQGRLWPGRLQHRGDRSSILGAGHLGAARGVKPPSQPAPPCGANRFSLYVTPPYPAKRRRVAVVGRAETTIIDDLAELEEFAGPAWSSDQLSVTWLPGCAAELRTPSYPSAMGRHSRCSSMPCARSSPPWSRPRARRARGRDPNRRLTSPRPYGAPSGDARGVGRPGQPHAQPGRRRGGTRSHLGTVGTGRQRQGRLRKEPVPLALARHPVGHSTSLVGAAQPAAHAGERLREDGSAWVSWASSSVGALAAADVRTQALRGAAPVAEERSRRPARGRWTYPSAPS